VTWNACCATGRDARRACELFESSLRSAGDVMELLGLHPMMHGGPRRLSGSTTWHCLKRTAPWDRAVIARVQTGRCAARNAQMLGRQQRNVPQPPRIDTLHD
jgi:hypothetical protein